MPRMVVDLAAPSGRIVRLTAIGTLAGLFSGLFGVGGGVVMVPLLVVWLGYGAREATGTSLAAIVVIAGVAVVVHAGYGNVDAGKGLFVGLPAVGGVLAGTWLQQRVPQRAISLAFSVVLVGVAVRLVAG
jgi:uncharacterized membrane protein YfcA